MCVFFYVVYRWTMYCSVFTGAITGQVTTVALAAHIDTKLLGQAPK